MEHQIDADAALTVWRRACTTSWNKAPVWFHGDIAAGNLLIRDGRLSAVIDFGCSGIGDPACDLVAPWTLLPEESQTTFRLAMQADDETWERARGWALWKALITMVNNPEEADDAQRVVGRILTSD